MIKLELDLNKKREAFPHYWEKCVGSGHAALGLRADWRKQLKQCKEELGFKYVRFHGLLNNDMSVYTKKEGYSFYNVNSLFDYILQIGMKPFVELSFMPDDLASGDKTVFHYKGNITPPKDYDKWRDLIVALVNNLKDRYGLDEIKSWYFEVWNEPNLESFWSSDMDEYFKLYKYTAEAVKSVDKNLKVGGPSTARNAWIPELIDYCAKNKVGLDFISTHHYPTDVALGHYEDMEERMAEATRGNMKEMALKARKETDEAKKILNKNLPLLYTEWNNSPSCRDIYHDMPYCASFLIKSIVDNCGIVDIYSFWTFSDIFEEMPQSSVPFHGGFGMINIHGISKPSYWAFKILHELGDEKIDIEYQDNMNVEAVATIDENTLKILIYNHNVPLSNIEDQKISIKIKDVHNIYNMYCQRIDEENGNPLGQWKKMGSSEYLDDNTIKNLKKDTEVKKEKINYEQKDNIVMIDTFIGKYGVLYITMEI